MQALITPENFYGLPQLPFNIHLGMEFERPSTDDGALLRLPAAAITHDVGGSVHRGAMYTLGEVAAAVCVLDSLVEALPVFLLTLSGEFRKVADPVGGVWTAARPSAANGATPVDQVRSRRKMNVTGEVSIYDERDRLVAEMSATFLARVLSNTMATALLAEAG
jgi:acyl-coenzyme A thioesterase PaaI-like protein